MKVVSTLGYHRGGQQGVFQYRRQVNGVEIDLTLSRVEGLPESVSFTHDEWTAIIKRLDAAKNESFRITEATGSKVGHQPLQSLYEELQKAVPNPSEGWNWHRSIKSYVCAILEHEGTLDIYAGPLGPTNSAIICLRRDTSV